MRIDLVGDAPSRSLIGFSAPVFPEPGTPHAGRPPRQILGTVLVVSDASQTLFPLLTRGNFPTQTGETLLVRREGNDIVYFSPLRKVPVGSQYLRFPWPAAPLPARLALEGRATFAEYNDYRGVAVLAATENIPVTGWGLVGKVDRAEALGDFHRMAVAEGLAGGLLIILLGGLLWFHRRDVMTRARKQDEKKFKALLESPPDVMIVIHPSGRIVFANSEAEGMFGYTLEELLGKTYLTLVPERFRAESSERFARLLSSLELHEQQTQREFWCRRKDGSEFPAEVTSSPIETLKGVVVAVSVRDITQRKRAEEALRESEQFSREIVANAQEGVVVYDTELRYQVWNRFMEELTGVPASEVLGKCGFDLFPHIREQGVDLMIRRALAGEVVHSPDMAFRVPTTGKSGWVSSIFSPHLGARGQIVGVISTIRDITEHKHAETVLQESEERYRTLFENAPVGLYRTTPEGHILAGNPAFVRMLGYSSFEELARRDLNTSDFEPDYPRTQFIELLDKQGEIAGLESVWYRRDGDVLHVRENVRAIRDDSGKILCFEGTAEDITQRKRAEAEHTRLVTAIEQSAEAVVITGISGDIQYVNPAFTRITGYSRQEVLGKNPRILKSDKQDAAFYQHLWATILQEGIWHGEIINRRKDGSLYTEEMNIAAVRGARGEITHFIATKQDVTERKTLEEHVRQAAKIEAVGRLAGGVAHDFNNLLTIMNGYTDLLAEELGSDHKVSDYLKEIKDAGERATTLTRQLLAFSRRQVLAPQVLDLNSVVSNLEKMLRRLIGEDIKLHTLLDPSLGRVKADPGQIEQVIMNLAVNARDAMPSGGDLTLETRNVQLDETFARSHVTVKPGPHIMLAVSDTGAGMTPETKERIFEPFFTTKEKGKGTGLGLATVYGIVKQSGGSIWVYSELGRGTSFKIYLPVASESPAARGHTKAQADAASGSETILVVEDEEGVRSLIRLALESAGYRVLGMEDGQSALAGCASYNGPIHLLLTDVVMPQLSGPLVAEKVTAMRPDIKVLYMSGYTDDAVVRHGVLSRDMPFIQKPFSPGALREKIREVLGGK
jgi:PAS domain S-box-containing protein